MSNFHRRVVLLPAGADPAALDRLAVALAEAVELQNRLAARCPHILRLSGPLQRSPNAFFITHEPAVASDPQALFRGDQRTPEGDLVQTAGGLLEALALAHAPESGRPLVHGGVAPGTVLTDADGLVKLTDFGFAPAICRALGVDAYLNLAIGPQPDATGAWEVLTDDVADRDDRLCGFIDPDKYGQDTLASFEPGSDIVAAGLVLYLLAERKHPYLYYEPEAHRVVDMARMMSFGVPSPVRRKDLLESTQAGTRAVCTLLLAMLARAPSERPTAPEALRRLRAAAPSVDLEQLNAQRWVVQLENALKAGQWRDLDTLLRQRPTLKSWPQDLLARTVAIERRAQQHLAELGEEAAREADRQAAEAWLARLQQTLQARDFKAAQDLLAARPTLKHWPKAVSEQVDALAGLVERELAAEKARAWQKALQKALQAQDWQAIARRFEQRPPPETCPPDVTHYAAQVEAEYRRHLQAEQHRQRVIAEQHQKAQEWLNRARELARQQQWVEALDVLAQPPPLEHWPSGAREQAQQITASCRVHLGDAVAEHLGEIEETVRAHGETLSRAVVVERFRNLLRPEHVETRSELVLWAPPNSDADARATLRVVVRPPAGQAAPEPVRGTLDFKLRGHEPQFTGGEDEFRRVIAEGLARQLGALQQAALRTLERELRDSVFPSAAVTAKLAEVAATCAAEARLLGPGGAPGALPVELRWEDAGLRWSLSQMDSFTARAVELARDTVRQRLRTEFLTRAALAREHESVLDVVVDAPASGGGGLPRVLNWPLRLTLSPSGGSPQVVLSATVAGRVAEQATLGDQWRAAEEKLTRLVVDAQTESLGALTADLKTQVRSAPTRVDLNAPKRSKTPTPEIRFELKPKGGAAEIVAATWNPRTFLYELGAANRAKVTGLVQGLAEAQRQAAAAAAAEQAAAEARRAEEARRKADEAAARKAEEERRKAEELAARQAADEARAADATKRKAEEEAARQAAAEARRAEEAKRKAEQEAARKAAEAQSQKEAAARTEPAKPKDAKQSVAVPGAAKPAPAPPGRKEPPRAPPAPQAEKKGVPKRRGLLLGAGLGAVAVLGVVALVFWPKSSGTPVTPREPNPIVTPPPPTREPESKPTPPQEKPVEPPTPPVAEPERRPKPEPEPEPEREPAPPVAQEPDRTAEKDAAALRATRLAAVGQHQSNLIDNRRQGNLVQAHKDLAALREVVAQLAGEPDLPDVDALERTLPATWEARRAELQNAGLTADGSPDALTGYPQRLKDKAGKSLTLVSVPAADPLWDELGGLGKALKSNHPLFADAAKTPADRDWLMFYIDLDEYAARGPADAKPAPPRRLPTRDEWFLAALKLRGQPGAPVGGLWEWCAEEGAPMDAPHWLCGGSRVLTEKYPPPRTQDLAEWWAWLTHPLVMQRREPGFGDDLAGARYIVPIHPARSQ
jgi:hypothetical protein